ncbi:MAG: hypothetical protein ACJ8AD_18775 [Gemmatimonadaceae bacterium]
MSMIGDFLTHHASGAGGARGLASVLLMLAAVISCAGGDSVTGPSGGALSPSSTPRGAIIGATTTRTPYEGTDDNKCLPGEVVPVHGSVAYAFFVSGTDVTHEKVKFSWVVDGTGTLSGSDYHGSDEYLEEINVSFFPMEQTFVHNVHMISVDKTVPDYIEQMLFHLTINGQGEVSAVVERGPTIECRS